MDNDIAETRLSNRLIYKLDYVKYLGLTCDVIRSNYHKNILGYVRSSFVDMVVILFIGMTHSQFFILFTLFVNDAMSLYF